MDEPRERRCEYEGAYFPNDQFEVDTDWGLVHKVEPRHTVGGTVIDFPSIGTLPGTPIVPPDWDEDR
jgi:hypothetical protein